MSIRAVIEHHTAYGALERINDDTFQITSTSHAASATVRVLGARDRAVVEFSEDTPTPIPVPLPPVLFAQLRKYGGRSFYASPDQLNDLLSEMAP
jgi:hypothetical protein